MTHEAPETRLRRLAMRAHRRGTREMDLVLGGFADANLAAMAEEALDRFELLLDENDQDLYLWVSRQAPAPAAHVPLIEDIRAHLDRVTRGPLSK